MKCQCPKCQCADCTFPVNSLSGYADYDLSEVYTCSACGVFFTEWQQSEISRQARKIADLKQKLELERKITDAAIRPDIHQAMIKSRDNQIADLRAKVEGLIQFHKNQMNSLEESRPLCPDHRDKQRGKGCLVCTIESLQYENARLHADLCECKSTIESLQDIANGAKQDGAEIIRLTEENAKLNSQLSEEAAADIEINQTIMKLEDDLAFAASLLKEIDMLEVPYTPTIGYTVGYQDALTKSSEIASRFHGKNPVPKMRERIVDAEAVIMELDDRLGYYTSTMIMPCVHDYQIKWKSEIAAEALKDGE